MKKATVYLVSACLAIWLGVVPGAISQTLIQSSPTDDLYDQYREDRYKDISDQEIMSQEFKKKKEWYQSLMTRDTPMYFKADHQEIIEKDHLFVLEGHVSIWKDDFKVLAHKVVINQWSGEISAFGNVEIHFADDVLTGDSAYYNFDTDEGWIKNARGSVKPSIFVEGDLIEKLVDYKKTGEPQYAIHNGFITACSGKTPDWKIKMRYGLVRIENYAHLNKTSFWISRVPIFYMPYLFYPTKTGRTTGFLIPDVSWSNHRGATISDEFFWAMNDYMDMTFGATYYSITGFEQEFEWRNAFDQYSQGELHIQHIKENESPMENGNPEERWRGTYEQSYIFPWDVRGTANMNFTSDQYFDRDYGYELEQMADRFMESRMSLSKYWDLAHLTIDGSYEKDFAPSRDETMQHLPRVDYSTGKQALFGNFNGIIMFKGEYLKREGRVNSSITSDSGTLRVEDWMDKDGLRADWYSEIWYDFTDVAWFTFQPWFGIKETWWNVKKDYDPGHPDGTWATYGEEPEFQESKFLKGIHESGDSIRREMYRFGFAWTGPKFYRIFPVLGYDRITKIKHLIEPEMYYTFVPEIAQDKIIEFDSDDHVSPEQSLMFSITNRFLIKVRPEKKKKKRSKATKDTSKEGDEEEAGENETGTSKNQEMDDDEGIIGTGAGKRKQKKENEDKGTIREFGHIRISQTYDFWKAQEWDKRDPPKEGEDERPLYPWSNISLDATINPFWNIYYSARAEYDPYHHSFSNGYLYGHVEFERWKFGVRWDYTKNFMNSLYDMHALALEGGVILNDTWSFASWVKYDFSTQYFPYFSLDVTYTSQCWAATLHTYYHRDREGFGTKLSPFEDKDEIQFGISIKFKNLDTVGPRKMGNFWWGNR